MNIFLSWSGDRSKAVADLMDGWLQCVIQAADPWMSSKDIDRGALWFSEINDQLQNTSIGIICLTQENKNKPWILFEAGALAKGLSTNRVCTFLVDLLPTDVGTPLSQFNHTLPNHDSVWELVRTLNSSLKEKGLKEKTLEQVFSTYWPQFDLAFKKILKDYPVTETIEKRSEDDILLEILSATRSMDKRVRSLEVGVPFKRIRNHNAYFDYETGREDKIVDEKFDFHKSLNERFIEYLEDGLELNAIIQKLSSQYNISTKEMTNILKNTMPNMLIK